MLWTCNCITWSGCGMSDTGRCVYGLGACVCVCVCVSLCVCVCVCACIYVYVDTSFHDTLLFKLVSYLKICAVLVE